MIKKLQQSSLDKQYVSLGQYSVTPISADYKHLVVTKPWGYEYLLFENLETETWHLSINYQRSTSTHCHPNKKTALVVLEGRALFSSLNESLELIPMDAMLIDAGVFHSTQSISKEGLRLLEFETPPMKHDLLRLEDKYGRAQSGYEGADMMTVGDQNILRLSSADCGPKKLCNTSLYIKNIKTKKDIPLEGSGSKTLVVVLSGIVRSKLNEIRYLPLHVLTLEEFQDTAHSFENVSVMFLSSK